MPRRNISCDAAAVSFLWALALGQLPIASAAPHKWDHHWDNEGRYQQEFHHTYALASNGAISLENVNGGVTVSAWDRNEVEVDAVKYARTEDYLANMEIQVDSRSDELRIKTHLPNDFNNTAGGVRYALTVPRSVRIDHFRLVNGALEIDGVRGGVNASVVNGAVKARGLAGEVEFSTVNGQQEVTVDGPDLSKPMRLESVNGAIQITLPHDISARLEANTVNGGIDSDFGVQVHHVTMGGPRLEGTLGNGGAEIRIRAVNGHIAIRRADRVAN